jgi:N-methylhydantoinase B/oxoprolinase/acetone carboxylase alpha subunit
MATTNVTERTLHPVTFEVLRRSFEYTCERMSQVLQKASFSPIIYDMVDFSNAIFDADVELVGQTANCPVHIAAMHFSARASLNKYPKETLQDGDVIVLNDPYMGGTHTPDVTFTAPIFFEGKIISFAVTRAHWTDVGANMDTHVAGEGLRMPPGKIVSAGVLNRDLIELIENMTRTPQYVEGDIKAQLGALWAAREEIQRIASKYGASVVKQGMREVLDYTQEMTKAAIREIPNGVYEAEDYVDSDGYSDTSVVARVKLTVSDERIHVDFTGSDKQCVGPINSPLANTMSAVYYSLKFFLNPDAPANAGMYRQIDAEVPEGTWLNPRWPAPTLGCTTAASSKLTGAIWTALAQAIPDRIVASTYSDANWFVANVANPDTGELQTFTDLPAGGWGGTPFSDGVHVTMDPLGNCQNLPAETAEMLFPIRYNSFEMIRDSPGAGKFRGGAGVRLEVEFLGRGEIVTMESSRTKEGSPGINGGRGASRQLQMRRDAQGAIEVIGGLKEDGSWLPQMLGGVPFKVGESFVFDSGGGGGWGNPLERDPEAVLEDVLNEIVSVSAARDLYGVVIAEGQIDAKATALLRA